MAKITIRDGWCEGHGKCAVAAPEVFEVGDDEQVVVLQDSPPDSLLEKVLEAERRCPRTAIVVER